MSVPLPDRARWARPGCARFAPPCADRMDGGIGGAVCRALRSGSGKREEPGRGRPPAGRAGKAVRPRERRAEQASRTGAAPGVCGAYAVRPGYPCLPVVRAGAEPGGQGNTGGGAVAPRRPRGRSAGGQVAAASSARPVSTRARCRR
ncbi:hypothetical protein GCM10009605_05110 [Nocardiopsis composta]